MSWAQDPGHPGLYPTSGLTADPDHPGYYLLTGSGLVEDPDHPGLYLIPLGDLIPARAVGKTTSTVTITVVAPMVPARVVGATTATAAVAGAAVIADLVPARVIGKTAATVAVTVTLPPGVLSPARVVSATAVTDQIPQTVYEFTQGITLPNQAQPIPPWYVATVPADPITGLTKALRPPVIANNKTTTLTWSFNAHTGTGHMWIRASSEEGYDFLRIKDNGVQVVNVSGVMTQSQDFTFPVTAGPHMFTFTYSKDYIDSGGDDTGYIYRISIPVDTSGFVVLRPRNPAVVAGRTGVSVRLTARHPPGPMRPHLVSGGTAVQLVPFLPVPLTPDVVFSQTDTQLTMELAHQFALDLVVGRTDVNLAADLPFTTDPVRGRTVVTVDLLSIGTTSLIPQLAAGFTRVRLVAGYEAGGGGTGGSGGGGASGVDPAVRNTPILIAFTASVRLEPSEMLVST